MLHSCNKEESLEIELQAYSRLRVIVGHPGYSLAFP